jgi:hypothetical protein
MSGNPLQLRSSETRARAQQPAQRLRLALPAVLGTRRATALAQSTRKRDRAEPFPATAAARRTLPPLREPD